MEHALEGIRILDLTRFYAGPMAARALADMGAEVIKIESHIRPDWIRFMVYPDNEPGDRPHNRSGFFHWLNWNKYGLTLDLGKSKGRDLFKGLVKISDIVVENFSPRVMENLGLGYQVLRDIKSEIILVSLSGWGQSGPYRDYLGYAELQDAGAGIAAFHGYAGGPPIGLGTPLLDAMGGMYAVFATLAALRQRRLTGEGQHIDVNLRETGTSFLGQQILDYVMNSRVEQRCGDQHAFMAPHGCYPCQGVDRWVAIAVSTDVEWKALRSAMNEPSWAQDGELDHASGRYRRREELDELIAQWTKEREHYEVTLLLQRAGVAAGPVLTTRDLFDEPHMAARGAYAEVCHPEVGTYRFKAPPWRLSKTPPAIRFPAPCLGEHNTVLLQDLLGLSLEEIEQLGKEGIIGTMPPYRMDA